MYKAILRSLSLVVVVGLLLAACAAPTAVENPPAGQTMPTQMPEMTMEPTEAMPESSATSAPIPVTGSTPTVQPTDHEMSETPLAGPASASDLRITLDLLLTEHVLLASSATGAALGGRQDEFEAAAAALDENSKDIAWAIGLVYGKEAEEAFLPLWRKHIGFVVDYTTGLATQDKAVQDQAVESLLAYTEELGAFFSSANPNLPKDAVADLVKTHILTLKDVIDFQAAGDPVKVYSAVREARGHMDMLASALAGGIALQFPEKFPGNTEAAPASLRSALNLLLSEHVYLAGAATGAALGGREDEFAAAADALDMNSQDIAAAIGSVYGKPAQDAFLPLWRKHIGFVVDYTTGLAEDNQTSQDGAVQSLLDYTQELGAFFSAANPNLQKDPVSELVKTHILTLKDVIDAQAAGDFSTEYQALRSAYSHMGMIADPLAAAIVKQFPEKFPEGVVKTTSPTPEMGSTTMEAMQTSIEIKLFTFSPETLEVPLGSTVTWTNQDDTLHTVTQGTPNKPGSLFDASPFGKDQTFSFTFTEAGDYAYFCRRHPEMGGVIRVTP